MPNPRIAAVDAGDGLPGRGKAEASRVLFVAVGAGLAIGIATSVGQGSLPEGLASLANSSGSWCLCAFALALFAHDPRAAAVVGFASLVAILAGHALATEFRGYPVATSMAVRWGVAAMVAGPALGVGAAWLWNPHSSRAAAGVAPIAGILLGEGLYGLTVVVATTSAGYWIGEIAVGLILMVLAAVHLRRRQAIALMLALSVIASASFYLAYTLVLGALL